MPPITTKRSLARRARRTLALVLLIAALPLHTAESSRQDPEPIELTAFIAHIDQLAAVLEDASADTLVPVLAAMPLVMRVRTDTGHLDVTLEPLARGLVRRDLPPGEWGERRDRLRAQLLDLRSEAEALLGSVVTPPLDAGRTALAGILDRREFGRQQPLLGAALWARIRAWLQDLWSRLGGERVDGRRVALVVVWLATATALGVMIVWACRAARRDPLPLERPLPTTPPPVPMTARAWALRALDAARGGQTREAVRCVYRAAVKRLEEQGVWRVNDTRTGREYVTLLPPGDTRRDRLSDIVGQLERAVYGNEAVSREEIERLAAHLEALGCVGPQALAT